ncbi:protein catecholamines up-like [Penaeus monodon]|uniref:protein catecholamines up-like n=1 Tax=Penaeus monodon TaxID=6687 RepID=UPI0018A73CE5|nr:protein catecholamines up-like [Penaeus monodon]
MAKMQISQRSEQYRTWIFTLCLSQRTSRFLCMCKRRIKRLRIGRRKSVSLENTKGEEFFTMMANSRLLLLFLVVAVAIAPLAVAGPLPVADPDPQYPRYAHEYGHHRYGPRYGHHGHGHRYGHHGYGHRYGHHGYGHHGYGFGHYGYGGPIHFISHLLHDFGHHHHFR